MVETIVGNGENASNQNFLLFPQCFQTLFFLRGIKILHGMVKCQNIIGKNNQDFLPYRAKD